MSIVTESLITYLYLRCSYHRFFLSSLFIFPSLQAVDVYLISIWGIRIFKAFNKQCLSEIKYFVKIQIERLFQRNFLLNRIIPTTYVTVLDPFFFGDHFRHLLSFHSTFFHILLFGAIHIFTACFKNTYTEIKIICQVTNRAISIK